MNYATHRPKLESIDTRLALLERATEQHDEALGALTREISAAKSELSALNATLEPMVAFYLDAARPSRLHALSEPPSRRNNGFKIAGLVSVITILAQCVEMLLKYSLHIS